MFTNERLREPPKVGQTIRNEREHALGREAIAVLDRGEGIAEDMLVVKFRGALQTGCDERREYRPESEVDSINGLDRADIVADVELDGREGIGCRVRQPLRYPGRPDSPQCRQC